MPFLDDRTYELLRSVGIIDDNGKPTPNAFIPSIQRVSLEEQCKLLGIPIIYRKTKSSKNNIEIIAGRYIESHYNGILEIDEGFWVKKMFGCFVDGFDSRKKQHKLSSEEIKDLMKLETHLFINRGDL